MLKIAVAGVLLSALGLAQASYTYFGSPCGSTLTVSGPPRTGTALVTTYTGDNFYRSTPPPRASSEAYGPWLLMGFSDQLCGVIRLPVPLPTNPACSLLVSFETFAIMPGSGGVFQSTMRLDLPNEPGLIGMTFYEQWLTFHNMWSTGFPPVQHFSAASNAVKLVIGQ